MDVPVVGSSMIELNSGCLFKKKKQADYGGVECHVGTSDGSVSGVKNNQPRNLVFVVKLVGNKSPSGD